MTERDLVNECMPQIVEMAVEIDKMTAEQYQEFKREHLEFVRKTCPRAFEFIAKIFLLIEWSLAA